jgi:polysaccharide biosynthesis transport protein
LKAQIVAQQFVDHFLEADATSQASQATDTVNFLNEQANGIQQQIAALENRVTQLKAENGSVLALGATAAAPAGDVSHIDSELAGLQAETAKLASTGSAAPQDSAVAQAEANLRVVQAKFSESHPDVIAAKAQLEAAKTAAAAKPSTNPVAAQIAANRAQMSALASARAQILSRSTNVTAAQSRAPALSAQADALDKAADALRDQYRAIGTKLQAAQIQARMESEQKGERLTLSDPPVVPDHPLRPNRPLIIAGSIAAGIGIGLALVLLIEIIFRPIRGTAALASAIGEQPLAVIPDFDRRPSWIVRLLERRTRRKLVRT